jgi:hypothetical protein
MKLANKVALAAMTALAFVIGCSSRNAATTTPPEPRTTHSRDVGVTRQERYTPQPLGRYPVARPDQLVSILEDPIVFGGYRCWLDRDGVGWHKSKVDGVWNAVLRRKFGPNEVSCLLESTDGSTVQRVELEAEFYKPGVMENEVLMQFASSSQLLMYPTTPNEAFAEAVASKRGDWSNGAWRLTRVPYANGGYGLMLTRTQN